MSLKKITLTLLATLIYTFSIAQERAAQVVEDIDGRTLLSRVNFGQHVNDAGTIVMYICADNPGDVTQVQVLSSKSTITDLKTLSAVANEALKMKFNAVRSALPQCGEMTFTFDAKPVVEKNIVAASKLGQNKVIGSRPTPPSANVETGDLGVRNILKRPGLSEIAKNDGLIVVYVCADKYGRVIKSEAVSGQSSIKDTDVLSAAEAIVKRDMKFSPGKGTDCMYYKIRIAGTE